MIMEFKNDCATLSFHKQSLRGRVVDYVITCHECEDSITHLIGTTQDLFIKLMEKYKDTTAMVRLVAKVNFEHVLSEELRPYHFGSYSSEIVGDPKDFFERHMMKMSQRLHAFNEFGSNLVIKNISHIHIQLSCKDPPRD